eukprot:144788-Amorphochlora_amoeboformis.AAC.1
MDTAVSVMPMRNTTGNGITNPQYVRPSYVKKRASVLTQGMPPNGSPASVLKSTAGKKTK